MPQCHVKILCLDSQNNLLLDDMVSCVPHTPSASCQWLTTSEVWLHQPLGNNPARHFLSSCHTSARSLSLSQPYSCLPAGLYIPVKSKSRSLDELTSTLLPRRTTSLPSLWLSLYIMPYLPQGHLWETLRDTPSKDESTGAFLCTLPWYFHVKSLHVDSYCFMHQPHPAQPSSRFQGPCFLMANWPWQLLERTQKLGSHCNRSKARSLAQELALLTLATQNLAIMQAVFISRFSHCILALSPTERNNSPVSQGAIDSDKNSLFRQWVHLFLSHSLPQTAGSLYEENVVSRRSHTLRSL